MINITSGHPKSGITAGRLTQTPRGDSESLAMNDNPVDLYLILYLNILERDLFCQNVLRTKKIYIYFLMI